MADNKLLAAAKWTSAAAAVRALMQVLQLVLVARLFPGDDLGALVLLFSIIAVAQLFADVGIANLVMHHQRLTVEELRNIRGMALGMGIILFVLLLSAAPLLARFYGDSRLHALVSLSGMLFLLNSLWQTKRALLEKSFDFRIVGSGEIIASLLSQATMLGGALLSESIFAVLIAPLGYSFIMALWLMFLRPDAEDFRFALSGTTLRRFAGYSAHSLGFNLTNSVSIYADIFIGGRYLSAAALGGHGIAKDLSLKIGWAINPIVTRIATPQLAKLQAERERLRTVYLQVMRITTALNFPVFTSLVVFSESYTQLVFGNALTPYQPSFILLGMWGLLRSVGNPSGSLMFALGKTRLAFYFSLGSMLLFSASAAIGARFGVVCLAFAMLISMAVQQIFAIWFFILKPLTGMTYQAYIRSLLPAASAAAMAFGGMAILLNLTGAASSLSWTTLLTTQVLAAVIYLGLLATLDSDLAQQTKRMFRKVP